MSKRVADDVLDGLLDAERVGLERFGVARHVHVERDLALPTFRFVAQTNLLEECRSGYLFDIELHAARFESGRGQQVADNAAQSTRFARGQSHLLSPLRGV